MGRTLVHPAATPARSPSPGGLQGGSRGRLLVLDDHAMILALLVRQLEDEGYEVLTETNAARAREAVLRSRPRLALVDAHMPPHERFHALRQLASLAPSERPGVIAMSGSDEAAVRDVAFSLGADRFVLKPWDVDDLARTVDELNTTGATDRLAEQLSKARPATLASGPLRPHRPRTILSACRGYRT
jgi:CheY-like chemotaxis protein